MTTPNQTAWQNMKTMLVADGHAPVVIGEPRKGMVSGTVAIIPMEGDIDAVTLESPREIHRVALRMYVAWLDDSETTENTLDQFRADIAADIFGDFNLGGAIAYALPTEFVWTYDEHLIQNGSAYRVINLLVAYRIDDTATFVP